MKTWHYNQTIGIKISKHLGNTNTHQCVTQYIVRNYVAWNDITIQSRFLEPAVGAGSFYFAIVDELLKKGFAIETIVEKMVEAYDVDPAALNILSVRLQEDYGYKGVSPLLFQKDFLLQSFDKQFDYVITNPPYVSAKNITPTSDEFTSKEEYLKAIKKNNQFVCDNRSDLYLMFYLKTLDLLTKNGKQIFLCSDSWIDSEYGEPLRDRILNKLWLSHMVNSVRHPFFRDDTNAIITVIQNAVPSETSTTQITSILDVVSSAATQRVKTSYLNQKQLKELFAGRALNLRNVLVLHGPNYETYRNFMKPLLSWFSPLQQNISVQNTSVSQSVLEKEGFLLPYSEAKSTNGVVPVFWQIQARVNKKPNYKNYIQDSEIQYGVQVNNLPEKMKGNVKQHSVYLSGIIDRFPLVFYMDTPSFHVSKYMHLQSNVLSPQEICVTLNNVFSFFFMEMDLKEGTRKTLRVGEMGLTKELKREDVKRVLTLDLTKFSSSDRKAIQKMSDKLKNVVLYNIEEALKNKDYMGIQKVIQKTIGMSDENFELMTLYILQMYYFRMRNLTKLDAIEKQIRDTLK